MGSLEHADAARVLPIVRLELGAEELRLEALGPHQRRVDHDQRPLRAPRMRMNVARERFLARARGPRDEHAAAGWRHLLRRRAQGIHRGGVANHGGLVADAQAKLGVLPFQTRRLERTRHQDEQPIGLERLLDEVIGTALDGGYRGFNIAVPADHENGQFRMHGAHALKQLHAIELAALEPDVENGQRRRRHGIDQRERACAIGGNARRVALVCKDVGEQRADIRLVIDDQDFGWHQALRFETIRSASEALSPRAANARPIRAPPPGRSVRISSPP